MNRINPLYAGIALVVLLIFVLFNLSNVTNEYHEAKESYKETLQLANELNGLNKIYANSSQTKKSLKKILNHSSLREANIKQKTTKSSIKLNSESMNLSALNFLMGKLLNSTYQIHSLKIKQLSEIRVSLEMEIKW